MTLTQRYAVIRFPNMSLICAFYNWLNFGQQETEGILPPAIPLSSEHVTDDGIYLLETGEDCLIYIGNSVDPDITRQLLGISSAEEIPSQVNY